MDRRHWIYGPMNPCVGCKEGQKEWQKYDGRSFFLYKNSIMFEIF